LGTNRGICYFDPANNSIRNYALRDGIQNYEYNTNAALKTQAGEIVLGGVGGFNLFHPDSVKQTSFIPPVVISEFKVNDQPYTLSEKIVLDYNQNSISIQFAGLSYFKNRYNLYACKLDGVNDDWVYCDTRRFSNFAGLPPGSYTFHVKASNYNGDWNNEGSSIHFVITPPFWNTWWFRTAGILAAAGVIYLLFLIRLKQRLRVELMRNKIARDLHDEVGSNLESISLFSAVAREKTNNPQMASIIGKISSYTQTSQEAMNDIVWMINTGNDTFEKVSGRMKKHASELFEATTTILHFNFDDRLNDVKLTMEQRKNFYLIYKEAVTNVVRHAKARNAGVFVSLVDDHVELSVNDDGKGFDVTAEHAGNGLSNMRLRAGLINAELEIKSSPGSGTKIMLSFTV
jgi:two-component sensor histidine kinase